MRHTYIGCLHLSTLEGFLFHYCCVIPTFFFSRSLSPFGGLFSYTSFSPPLWDFYSNIVLSYLHCMSACIHTCGIFIPSLLCHTYIFLFTLFVSSIVIFLLVVFVEHNAMINYVCHMEFASQGAFFKQVFYQQARCERLTSLLGSMSSLQHENVTGNFM